ncbi:MAG: hypothetical protein J5493_07850 [Lachnospiraceae bacterium]|nr:hypothetical protein [Lachnospiraceae bacterium]
MSIFSILPADIAWTVFDMPFRQVIAVGAAVLIVVAVTALVIKTVKKKGPAPKSAAEIGAVETEPGPAPEAEAEAEPEKKEEE